MAATKDTPEDKDKAKQGTTTPTAGRAATTDGPEARGQKGAASLEEAMAQSDALAKEQNTAIAEEGAAEQAATAEESAAAIEEAGAAQEARDDAVYRREPGGETAVPGTWTRRRSRTPTRRRSPHALHGTQNARHPRASRDGGRFLGGRS